MALFREKPLNYYPRYLKDFSHRKRVKNSYTLQEAQLLAPQYLKQVQECTNLVNTTTNPDVYFKRYDMMISCLVELKKMQKVIKFSGKPPAIYLNEVISTREKQLDYFVDRIFSLYREKIIQAKTQKTKENYYTKFVNIMYQITCEFSNAQINRVKSLTEALRAMCGAKI